MQLLTGFVFLFHKGWHFIEVFDFGFAGNLSYIMRAAIFRSLNSSNAFRSPGLTSRVRALLRSFDISTPHGCLSLRLFVPVDV